MLTKLTLEQMQAMPTPRLLAWFRKARNLFNSTTDEAIQAELSDAMRNARSVFESREHVKRK